MHPSSTYFIGVEANNGRKARVTKSGYPVKQGRNACVLKFCFLRRSRLGDALILFLYLLMGNSRLFGLWIRFHVPPRAKEGSSTL